MNVKISKHCERQLRRVLRDGGRRGRAKVDALIAQIATGKLPAGSRRIMSTSHTGAWRCASGEWRVLFVPGQHGEPPTVIAAGNRSRLYKEEFAL